MPFCSLGPEPASTPARGGNFSIRRCSWRTHYPCPANQASFSIPDSCTPAQGTEGYRWELCLHGTTVSNLPGFLDPAPAPTPWPTQSRDGADYGCRQSLCPASCSSPANRLLRRPYQEQLGYPGAAYQILPIRSTRLFSLGQEISHMHAHPRTDATASYEVCASNPANQATRPTLCTPRVDHLECRLASRLSRTTLSIVFGSLGPVPVSSHAPPQRASTPSQPYQTSHASFSTHLCKPH
jgi:hypothetical protein